MPIVKYPIPRCGLCGELAIVTKFREGVPINRCIDCLTKPLTTKKREEGQLLVKLGLIKNA